MKDDYLWDGSGEPDPEVQKLETALGRYRHNKPAPAFDHVAQTPAVKAPKRFFNLRFSFQLAAVAATLLIAATLLYFLRRPNPGVDSVLGCVYTLQVDDSGAGVLRTTMGWVGFKLNGHESFIPAGAICQTRPKIGPGTPYMEDAPQSFREALSRFDFESHTPAERDALLGILLVDARKNDALTLIHLLSRVSDADRPSVYDRLTALALPPAGVTRDGILPLDRPTLNPCS